MNLPYGTLINKLEKRRFDEALRETVVSESFSNEEIPVPVRYARESMLEVDPSYSFKVYANVRKIHEKIEAQLKRRGYKVDFRYQGSIKFHANVRLYGSLEMLVIRKRISEKPYQDIKSLAIELMDILSNTPGEFRSVDFEDETRIKIRTLKPSCDINILPSMWIDTKKFVKTNQEVYRGIAEFDFSNKKIIKYTPFLDLARINAKEELSNGNYLSLVRFIRSLCCDLDEPINLSTYEICSILFIIPNRKLYIRKDQILSILPLVRKLLTKLLEDEKLYSELSNPSQTLRIFKQNDKRRELSMLRRKLHMLIADIKESLESQGKSIKDEISYEHSF